MKTLLALDLSTTACGWSFWDIDKKELLNSGTVRTPTDDFKDNFAKIDFLILQFQRLLPGIVPDFLFVEEALQKLSGGNSSAQVIAKLIQMNFAGTYALRKQFGDCPYGFIDVRLARKTLGIKIPRGENAKEVVFSYIKSKYPELKFEYKKTGRPKDWEYDRCDAIVLGAAAILLNLPAN